jgi:hypothetical protein
VLCRSLNCNTEPTGAAEGESGGDESSDVMSGGTACVKGERCMHTFIRCQKMNRLFIGCQPSPMQGQPAPSDLDRALQALHNKESPSFQPYTAQSAYAKPTDAVDRLRSVLPQYASPASLQRTPIASSAPIVRAPETNRLNISASEISQFASQDVTIETWYPESASALPRLAPPRLLSPVEVPPAQRAVAAAAGRSDFVRPPPSFYPSIVHTAQVKTQDLTNRFVSGISTDRLNISAASLQRTPIASSAPIVRAPETNRLNISASEISQFASQDAKIETWYPESASALPSPLAPPRLLSPVEVPPAQRAAASASNSVDDSIHRSHSSSRLNFASVPESRFPSQDNRIDPHSVNVRSDDSDTDLPDSDRWEAFPHSEQGVKTLMLHFVAGFTPMHSMPSNARIELFNFMKQSFFMSRPSDCDRVAYSFWLHSAPRPDNPSIETTMNVPMQENFGRHSDVHHSFFDDFISCMLEMRDLHLPQFAEYGCHVFHSYDKIVPSQGEIDDVPFGAKKAKRWKEILPGSENVYFHKCPLDLTASVEYYKATSMNTSDSNLNHAVICMGGDLSSLLVIKSALEKGISVFFIAKTGKLADCISEVRRMQKSYQRPEILANLICDLKRCTSADALTPSHPDDESADALTPSQPDDGSGDALTLSQPDDVNWPEYNSAWLYVSFSHSVYHCSSC